MKILILGAGKMGAFFADTLSFDHSVAVLDNDPRKLRYLYNTERMSRPEEAAAFNPDMVINCVTIQHTIGAFKEIMPHIGKHCILSDIASVKTGIKEFYENQPHPYVSTHPMFGPTFASLSDLSEQNTIIITESEHMGKVFFRDLYRSLQLKIFEYSFEEHDAVTAYSLSIPFVSTMVFASVMEPIQAPGTTFKKHLNIAHGLLSEDDYLLTEILFNPNTPEKVKNIRKELATLLDIIERKDSKAMEEYLIKIRKNITVK